MKILPRTGGKVLKNLTPEGGKVLKKSSGKGPYVLRTDTQVSRDGLAFFLTEHTGDCPAGGLVHLYVPDVDAWFDEFRRKEIRVQDRRMRACPGRAA